MQHHAERNSSRVVFRFWIAVAFRRGVLQCVAVRCSAIQRVFFITKCSSNKDRYKN